VYLTTGAFDKIFHRNVLTIKTMEMMDMNLLTYAMNAGTLTTAKAAVTNNFYTVDEEKKARELFIAANVVDASRVLKMSRGVISPKSGWVTRVLCAVDAWNTGKIIAGNVATIASYDGDDFGEKTEKFVKHLRSNKARVKSARSLSNRFLKLKNNVMSDPSEVKSHVKTFLFEDHVEDASPSNARI